MKLIGSCLTVCLTALIVLLEVTPSFAQQSNPPVTPSAGTVQPQPPFWNEIAQFRHSDSIHRPPTGAILFVGSSSIRKWTNVQTFFPGYTIINRGFGGSTLPDVIRYSNEIIFPYRPKQIVIYCGDNDLASSDSVTARIVYNRFVKLYNLIRSRLGDVDIVFISIKPSPSRMRLMPRMEEANDLIRDFMAEHSHAVFADVYHPMLGPTGQPVDSLFLADKLHMNEKGYKIWQQVLLPYLDK
ncbi:MAG TPA: GDSL-type esterase/lipase family protein [Puia sp.]|nr:GDSL-type esterase/lipase family protein [Puia sp.]